MSDIDTRLVRVEERLINVQKKVETLELVKVNLDRFNPVERLVYGLVALVLSAVLGGLLTLVVTS